MAVLTTLISCWIALTSNAMDAGAPATQQGDLPHASGFRPSQHGFQYANAFRYPSFLPDRWYGLCGGMSCAAADAFLAGVSLPDQVAAPTFGSRRHRALVKRQLASLGLLATDVMRYGWWMARGDRSLARATLKEADGIIERVVRGEFVVLGLVQESWWERPDITGNHQVLAYAVADSQPRAVRIYDPNFPGNDDVVMEFRATEHGVEAWSVVPDWRTRRIRGVFATGYRPQPPMR